MTLNEPNLPPELGRLSAFIDSHVECLTGSSNELRSIALCAAKHVFDWALGTEGSSKPHLRTLLATLSESDPPQTRSRARGTSTTPKRTPSPVHRDQKKFNIQETPLPYLFIESMSIDQMWQQLDLRAERVCENLQVLQGEGEGENEHSSLEESSEDDGSEDDESEDDDEDAGMDVDVDDSPWEGLGSEEDEDGSTAEGIINLQDELSENDEDEGPTSMLDAFRGQQKLSSSRSHSQGFSNLDDGFFDLATFNAETSEAVNRLSETKLDLVSDDDSTEESEIDLFGSVDDLETDDTGNELFYGDFFEPPPRAQNGSARASKVRFHERVSVKKIKAVGKGMPVSSMGDEDSDEEENDE